MPELYYSSDFGGTEKMTEELTKIEKPTGLFFSEDFGGTEPSLMTGGQQMEAAPVGAETAPQQPAPPEEEQSYWEQFKEFFTGEKRTTPEVERLPELTTAKGVTTGDFWKDLKVAGGMMLAASDEAKKDIIKENFPDVKFIEDQKGTTIMEFPDGKRAVLNKPGFSFQDVYGALGQIAAFYGPSKLASLGKTLGQRMAIGGGAAALTEAGLEKGLQQIGSKQEVSPEMVTTAGVLGGAGEAIVPLVKGIIPAKQAKRAGVTKEALPETVESIQRGEQITKETGIPLFKAQKTLDPAQLEKQSFLPSLSAGSKKASTELKKQNTASFKAVEDVLNRISSPKAVETGPAKIKTAIDKALDARKAVRAEKASPLYETAKADTTVFALPETQKTITDIVKDYPTAGTIPKQMRKISSLIGQKSNIQKLHGAKTELDDMISKAVKAGDNNQAREMIRVKESLLKEMDEASPAYKEAREVFARETPAIQELEDSILGKIGRMDETQLKSIAPRLFDPAETNPQVIKNAKQIIEEVDPQAWRDITRTELERRIGSIKADIKDIGAENVPGQLYRAIFGNSKQRNILFAGLDKETAKSMRYLEEGLRRASKGRPGGSQTATREEIKKELKGGFGSAFRDLFKKPIDTLVSTGEEAAFNKRVRAAAEVFFDPKWNPRLEKLRKLPPNSEKAANEFKKLVLSAEKGLEEITPTLPQLAKPQQEGE